MPPGLFFSTVFQICHQTKVKMIMKIKIFNKKIVFQLLTIGLSKASWPPTWHSSDQFPSFKHASLKKNVCPCDHVHTSSLTKIERIGS